MTTTPEQEIKPRDVPYMVEVRALDTVGTQHVRIVRRTSLVPMESTGPRARIHRASSAV